MNKEEKEICRQMGEFADFVAKMEAEESEEDKKKWKDKPCLRSFTCPGEG